ncbi:MAG: type II toxin-antitoxin system HipA family toxin YjjJ [Pseudomonadota bacterium]
MTQKIVDALSQGPATSKELQATTGLSQATVARHLKILADSVIKIPNGRSPIYAFTRSAFGGDDKLPLYIVDAYGNNSMAGTIRPLSNGQFFLEPATGMPELFLGVDKTGLFDDLPYFLQDLRPQGFIGRQIAIEMAKKSDEFPNDPERWSTSHIGRYLVSNGDDLPGNLKFGEQAHLRMRQQQLTATANDYPDLANGVLDGQIPGSSAGGEQPKFTAYCKEKSAHVIVKFSPQGEDPLSSRWRDILITEHYASQTAKHFEWPVAETRLIEDDGRIFLESVRFDRNGQYGRLSMISLSSVDAEFVGRGQHWPLIMNTLFAQDLVSWQHVFDTEQLWVFGRMINNTDMHLGNLSLAIDGSVFRLLPAYDMWSMGFAPRGAELRPYSFDLPVFQNLLVTKSPKFVAPVARYFWDAVVNDPRISDDFRRFIDNSNVSEKIYEAYELVAEPT